MIERVTENLLTDTLTSSFEPVYPDELVTIYHADSTRLVPISDESVDLVVTSPPYNLDVSYAGYQDTLAYDAYLGWVAAWAEALYRVARPGGRACVNIPL